MEPLERHFGLVIAFLLPGFTCLWGLSAFSPSLAIWLAAEPAREPSIGGFLYVVLGSLAAGLVVSAIRWVSIDRLHHKTGIPCPELDFARLTENLGAYHLAVEHNYRYFQFYANMAVAIVILAICRQWVDGLWPVFHQFLLFVLEAILFMASRDCLKRYYGRVALVLGTTGRADA